MINKIVNNLIKFGNKGASIKVLRHALINIKNTKLSMGSSLESTLKLGSSNVQPKITFVNKKIAGVVHKVPKPYENLKNFNLSTKWFIQNSKKRSEIRFKDRLSSEIIESISKKSLSFKKKLSLHKMGLGNRTNLKYM